MKALGTAIIVMALVTGVVPLLTDCQSQGRALTLANGQKVPMKCHWTAVAEAALAVPLVGVGAAMVFSRRKETHRMLTLVGGLLALFVVLVPTVLIGVCASSDMLCNSVMRPTLIFTGVITAAALAANLVFSERRTSLLTELAR